MLKDLPELVQAGIISPDLAENIRSYYLSRKNNSPNRLFIAFGILGAMLIGLGILLIIAHNWDEFSRTIKTIWAFTPLVIGQVFCGWALFRRQQNTGWKEVSAAFLFLAIGTSIALVSQIYHIPGDQKEFMLTWMITAFPLVYLMNSSSASLLYIIGITYYSTVSGYTYPSTQPFLYWPLLLLAIPHYYLLIKNKPSSNFTGFHHWIIPISLVIALGTMGKSNEELLVTAYTGLFGLFILFGRHAMPTDGRLRQNGFLVTGVAGLMVILYMFSFSELWKSLRGNFNLAESILSTEGYLAIVFTILALIVFFYVYRNRSYRKISPFEVAALVFMLIYFLGIYSPVAVILTNILVLAIGLLVIREGSERDHLGILNLGLLIIGILVAMRFFDSELSFVLRGILFVAVGAGFFAANYLMIAKRRSHAK